MNIEKQLRELIGADVITQQIAENITGYYVQKRNDKPNPVLVIFGILGAILGGLGIILILAHNWDNLSVGLKSIIAFLPLLLGQLFCGYTLLRKKGNPVWSESSSSFLFIAIGASISLVSQIYHIPGNFSTFLITWMLLGLPLVYLLRSYSTSLLYIVGITFYSMNYGHSSWSGIDPYWILLAGIVPFIVWMHKTDKNNNFLNICYWLLTISLSICLSTLAYKTGILMFIAYMSFFGVIYSFGHSKWMSDKTAILNGPRTIGGLGMLVMLFIFSFDVFWKMLHNNMDYITWGNIDWDIAIYSPEIYACIILTLIAAALLFMKIKDTSLKLIKPMSIVPFVFILVFILGYYWNYSQVAINVLILLVGASIIKIGADGDNLGLLNKGLGVITVLALWRFFDTNISFVLKGIIFLLVGIGFFVANYMVIRKRKNKLNQ